jgi:hypothetical protein
VGVERIDNPEIASLREENPKKNIRTHEIKSNKTNEKLDKL